MGLPPHLRCAQVCTARPFRFGRHPCSVVSLTPTRLATRVAATFGLENLHTQTAPGTPPPSQTAPRTPRTEAAERIGKRYKEMLESECQLCEDMEKLITTLTATSQVLRRCHC